MDGIIVTMEELQYAFLRCEATAELAVIVFVMLVRYSADSCLDCHSFSGFIMFLHCSIVKLSQIQTSGSILAISLRNFHGNGVEHPDKTLLLGGLGRRQVLY